MPAAPLSTAAVQENVGEKATPLVADPAARPVGAEGAWVSLSHVYEVASLSLCQVVPLNP